MVYTAFQAAQNIEANITFAPHTQVLCQPSNVQYATVEYCRGHSSCRPQITERGVEGGGGAKGGNKLIPKLK